MFNVGVTTGYRASDLLRIKVSDVAAQSIDGTIRVLDDAEVRIKEKKTGKGLWIKLKKIVDETKEGGYTYHREFPKKLSFETESIISIAG